MEQYKRAFENLQVPKDMCARVLKHSKAIASQSENMQRPSSKGKYRYAAAFAACAVLVWGVFFFSSGHNQPLENPLPSQGSMAPMESSSQGHRTGNPMQAMEDLDTLQKNLPFPLKTPKQLPAGYSMEDCFLISGTLAQVNYTAAGESIRYRMAQGGQDISGDYNAWPEAEKRIQENGEITLKGKEGKIYLANWTDSVNSYSLTFSAGIDIETVMQIINSVASQ